MKTKFTFLFIVFFAFLSHAQTKVEVCVAKIAEFNEYVKESDFSKAFLPWSDVRKKCPSLDETIYTSGEKIILSIIEKTITAEEKEINVRDLLKVYDEYDKYFPKNNKGNGIKKAMALYDNKIGTSDEVYGLLDIAFKKDPENFSNPTILYLYFDLFYNQFKEGKSTIEPNALFVKHDAITARIALASKVASVDDLEAYERVVEGMDALMSGVATCDKLIPFYQKDFDSKKADVIWLEAAASNLFSKKCDSDPLFLKIATELHQINATSKSAYYLGMIELKNRKQDKAIIYFSQSADLNTDLNEKAKTCYRIATFLSNSNKTESRVYAQKALLADPSFGKAYLLIAQLYANSFNECGQTPFEKKAIYFLAAETARKAGEVDLFLKSTANQQAESYLKSAPSNSEIAAAKKSNKKITFSCWINESVTIPKL